MRTAWVAIVLLAFVGCGEVDDSATPSSAPEDSVSLAASQFKGRWPLTVSRGSVRCENSAGSGIGNVIFRDADGNDYAVNGTAMDHTDLPEIDEIWRAPDKYGMRRSMDPILSRGLKLCR